MKQILLYLTLCLLAVSMSMSSSAQLANGSTAPNFTITDLDGNEHELYDYLNQGYTVVIDLYAVWCGPCWDYHNTGTGHPNAGALKELHNQYGPDGTDEVIVMGIESDPTTPAADIDGGPSSLGDWTANVPYIMANDDFIAGLYNLTFYPTVYRICPNGEVIEIGQESVANLYGSSQSCPVVEGTDGALLQPIAGELLTCNDFDLNILLQNTGDEELTSANIEAVIDGEVVASLEWSGNLSTYEMEEIELGSTPLVENSEVTYNITSSDAEESNNTSSTMVKASVLSSSEIIVRVKTDYYAGETAWEIRDSNGSLIESHQYEFGDEDDFGGGGPDANTTHDHVVSLGTDVECFEFTITDAYGDGMVYHENGSTNPSDFGYEIHSNFTDWEITSGDGSFSVQKKDGFRTDESSSISNLSNETSLNIYPNPSNGISNISFDLATAGKVTLNLYNMVGQNVMTKDFGQLPTGHHNNELKLEGFEPGVYLVNFTVNGETITKRLTLTR